MNYPEAVKVINFLAEQVRLLGLPPMYKWNIPNTWTEYKRWAKFLGYKED